MTVRMSSMTVVRRSQATSGGNSSSELWQQRKSPPPLSHERLLTSQGSLALGHGILRHFLGSLDTCFSWWAWRWFLCGGLSFFLSASLLNRSKKGVNGTRSASLSDDDHSSTEKKG